MGVDKFYRKVVGPSAKWRDTVNCIKQALEVTATPVAITNPLGADIIVTEIVLDLTANATATPVTADIGCAAASAVVSNDDLIDGISVGTPVGAKVFNSANDKGTNGAMSRKWGSAKYLTMVLTGTPTGIAGNLYVYYRKA